MVVLEITSGVWLEVEKKNGTKLNHVSFVVDIRKEDLGRLLEAIGGG